MRKFYAVAAKNFFNKKFINYDLCLVTDQDMAKRRSRDIDDIVDLAIRNGCTMIQYREKDTNCSSRTEVALSLKKICHNRVPFIINDDVKLAYQIDADGVHIGQSDGSLEEARRILGQDKIVGVTVGNLTQLEKAIKGGADYLGTDAVYETATKPGKYIGIKALNELTKNSAIPIVAIGGINSHNLSEVLNAGATGVAVISSIIDSEDPSISTRTLKESINNSKIQGLKSRIEEVIRGCKAKQPLVLQLTNNVVMTQSANITLAIGASPIMAQEPQEMEDLVKICDSLLLNIGTINQSQLDLMLQAGKIANKLGKPIVFDPVGVGASKFRLEASKELINKLKLAVIKGNSSEIAVLSNLSQSQKGVDGDFKMINPHETLSALSKSLNGTIIVMTGKSDFISNGVHTVELMNNNSMLPMITGSGCMLGSMTAAYQAVGSDGLNSAAASVLALTVSSELCNSYRGPASFYERLIDNLYLMDSNAIKDNSKIRYLQ